MGKSARLSLGRGQMHCKCCILWQIPARFLRNSFLVLGFIHSEQVWTCRKGRLGTPTFRLPWEDSMRFPRHLLAILFCLILIPASALMLLAQDQDADGDGQPDPPTR